MNELQRELIKRYNLKAKDIKKSVQYCICNGITGLCDINMVIAFVELLTSLEDEAEKIENEEE